MRMLGRRQGRSLQPLMAEAVNDVLRKPGESPIGDWVNYIRAINRLADVTQVFHPAATRDRLSKTGASVTELCHRRGMSSAIYCAWKAKFGGREVSDAKRLRALEEENARLKRQFADMMLDIAELKDLSKNGDARRGGSHQHGVSLVPADDGDLRSRLCELVWER
jgi:putative transposase